MSYKEAISNKGTVLVEFYATWCPHCRRMAPVVDQVKESLGDRVPVYQFDIDRNETDAETAEVEIVPTFIVYRDGKEVWRYSGEISGDALLGKVETFV